ncbi:hypothetical protein LUX12_22345 [Streptomyces somaliensis]|uniref:hypothetical protein n=1 Tax=Streptomyces somaliensis TaxID=78355 RepID=UPI0020CEEADA|nr:hypothetical protein [Streptomyces somaliensis]MCP9946931.1 hypothetical protein [Streptomyces somaliensis]
METALRRAFAGLSLLIASAWWLTAASLSVPPGPRPLVMGVTVLVAAAATVWVHRGAFVRIGPVDAWCALVLAVAVHAVYAVQRPAGWSVGLRCTVTTVAVLLAVAHLPRRRGWPVSAVALAAQVAAGWQEGAVTAGEGTWPVLAAGVATAAVVPVLRTARRPGGHRHEGGRGRECGRRAGAGRPAQPGATSSGCCTTTSGRRCAWRA